MTPEPNRGAGPIRSRSRWSRIGAALAVLLGGLVIFLAYGFGITGSDGLAPGAILVFVATIVSGGGLVFWGVERFRA